MSTVVMDSRTDQDLELSRINMDLRMEQTRQSSSQYSFDHFQSILKRNLKDKRLVTDVDTHADLQKAISLLQEDSLERESESAYTLSETVRQLASNLDLTVDAQSDAYELKGERIQMSIILNPDGKEISSCYVNYTFDEEEKESDSIKHLLEEKKIDELTAALQKMVGLVPDIIQVNNAELKSANTLSVLRMLESDIVAIKARSEASNENLVDRYALEFFIPRSELHPTTFVLLAEPFLRDSIKNFSESHSFVDYDKILYSAYLCLKRTGVLYNFPGGSYLDQRGNWIDDSSSMRLPVEYCLAFTRPILLSRENYDKISNFSGVSSLNILGQTNLFRHLSSVSNHEKLNLKCRVSPELGQFYEFPECDSRNSDAVVINEIHFVHPRNLTTILQIIRDQLLLNTLFESLCHRSSARKAGARRVICDLAKSWIFRISGSHISGFADLPVLRPVPIILSRREEAIDVSYVQIRGATGDL
ncbi:mediator of RNA polymerase II transcription subunit 1.1 [Ditylenchus destructor]|uniref:Mediator of RNA polymerase II transcription subunit 1.1 n=1 Tax=Ditylenchus destructor TaxID=166010 RepID=A0AAD4RDW0_9BILA|nr:mediator of RNA polymerase II transcription subunit 1.1 [Ditylenchus destructor]